MTDQQIDKIGRTETFKMLFIAATLTVVLPTIFGFTYVAIDCGLHCLSFNALTETLCDKWTYIHVLISGLILSLSIYLLGPWTARQIIQENKNKFIVGLTTFLCLWTVWFVCSEIVNGFKVKATLLYSDPSVFSIIINGWWFLSLIMTSCIAIPTSAIFGYFLGRQVKKKGEKLACL